MQSLFFNTVAQCALLQLAKAKHQLIVDGNARSEALARRMGCQFEGEFTHETFGKSRIFRHPARPA